MRNAHEAFNRLGDDILGGLVVSKENDDKAEKLQQLLVEAEKIATELCEAENKAIEARG